MGLPWIVPALAGVAVLLLIMLWSARRHRNPVLRIDCNKPIDELLPSITGLTFGHCTEGNAVEVLENGAFFDRAIERIRQARATVHFETFLWKDGALGRRMADAFAERARAGLEVRILLDANGCRGMGKEVREQLKAAGCRVALFHRMSIANLGVLNDRDHRKIVVLDGQEAFVGGHCIVDEWLGDAEDGRHYADVSVHLRGPIVHAVQSAFSENWCGETGELFAGPRCFPELQAQGDVVAHAVFAKPERSAPAVKILHHTVICLARRRLWIQNPYFIPEPEAIEAFADAVRRGVDVRVLMPSTSGSDNPMVQHAGHRNFERLLESGVRLFEYPHTLLHQKVMTVDGIWSSVGSCNFDDRSFDTNDEIVVGMLDPGVATRLDAVFERYVGRAQEIDLARWRARGSWHKLKDHLFYLANELL